MSYTEADVSRSLTGLLQGAFAKCSTTKMKPRLGLSLPPTTTNLNSSALRHAAGEPFALKNLLSSAAEFPGLLDAPHRPGIFFGSSNAITKSNSAMPTKKLTRTAADPRSRRSRHPPPRPLLRIRQVIYSTKGRAIMYVLGFLPLGPAQSVIRRFR